MSNFDDVADRVRDLGVYSLADMAGVRLDSQAGAGATWLAGIRDAVLDDLAHNDPEDSADVQRVTDEGCHEWADAEVPIYTGQRWEVFTSLSAWEVDTSDYGAEGDDMTAMPGVALYDVAYRLIRALADEVGDLLDGEA